jgi:catechol 2,3-dioxygenase-like lactoylglutathione lyase family enzyme
MKVPDSFTRLSHVALVTGDIEASIRFYEGIVGLSASAIEPDPIRPGCRRTYLSDSRDQRIIELIDNPAVRHRTIPGNGAAHHVGFSVSPSEWVRISSRADEAGEQIRQNGSLLFLRDPDGIVLEIERDRSSDRDEQ